MSENVATECPLVFVLVLNYLSLEDTIKCVESIRASAYQNLRLLVIDNASPDGCGIKLEDHLGEDEFLQLRTNTGYAGGNNVGMKIAIESGAKYVFILNPDVRLSPTTISQCVTAAEMDYTIGAVNPIQVLESGGFVDKKFLNAILKPAGYGISVYQAGEFPDLFEAKELLGAALFIPVSVIKRVGGFDPLYFAYGEETDLCRRLRYHGYKLAVTGNATVMHLRTKESLGVKDRILFLRLKGLYLGILKDPRRSFRRSVGLVTIRFWQELLGKRKNEYPFNQYPVTRLHSIRALLWVMVHLIIIRNHRRLEQAGRAHV